MLTPAQLQTLKAAIAAETDATFVGYRTQGATGLMAEWFNLASTFVVWRSWTPTDEIANAISWQSLTPADAPDGTQTWANRSLACQGKQFNLQSLLLASGTRLASGKANVRAGLQDALTNVPAGAGGSLLAANWVGVRTAIQRNATRGEKLFATGTGTAVAPGNLEFEGNISDADIVQALGA